jgi:radical SAM protein with 4Fe4S-binding SPASM domain
MWSSVVFTWDGKVVPCCFDKDAEFQMGSVKQTDFDTIWKSAIYSDFRKKLQRHRQGISICANCSEGSKVWV